VESRGGGLTHPPLHTKTTTVAVDGLTVVRSRGRLAGAPTQAPLSETTSEKTTTWGGEVNEPAEAGLPDNR